MQSEIRKTSCCASRPLGFVFLFTMLIAISTISSPFVSAQYLDPEAYSDLESILEDHCYDCHGGGASDGGIALDDLLEMEDSVAAKKIWHRAFKQVQSSLMPPPEATQLDNDVKEELFDAIKFNAFELDRETPNPGKVTIRRLNRIEYRNTVKDLLDFDYNTAINFPEDDSGHGFDNMSDVLTVSPLLFEKYVNAANEIVSSLVPTTPSTLQIKYLDGAAFVRDSKAIMESRAGINRTGWTGSTDFSYYRPRKARAVANLEHSGQYKIQVKLHAHESYVDDQFDSNACEFAFSIDGKELLRRKFVRQGGKRFDFDFDLNLEKGPHECVVSVKPLTKSKQIRKLRIQFHTVSFSGPNEDQYLVKPKGHDRFFPEEVPADPPGRRAYAKKLLGEFATKAFRRPVEQETLDRLVSLAESTYENGQPFEAGIAKSMTAILAAPRFIFREESIDDNDDPSIRFPLIDEYSLASRLSYFFWSTMPDAELVELAVAGKLRENLDGQVQRMLAHEKANAFTENYIGQWLRSRAIETIQIDTRSIKRRELPPDPEFDAFVERFRTLVRKKEVSEEDKKEIQAMREEFRKRRKAEPKYDFSGRVRRAMRRETEMLFEHILKNNLSVLELIDSDYTFLNEDLAEFYEIPGLDEIKGRQMRLVQLPKNSDRGGILTQGTFLVSTSNPDRTSPVKRGLYIMENLLGVPIAAPPPNIPSLEDAQHATDKDKVLSMRESMEIHRADPLCYSCHRQMDAFGLVIENFNAVGRFREQEYGEGIDTRAEMVTGEEIASVKELKRILVSQRKTELYRCFVEKMLMYALGREVDYHDVQTVDEIVEKLESDGGKIRTLIDGIVHSVAFQRTQLQIPESGPKK